jgi:hypothetical protein
MWLNFMKFNFDQILYATYFVREGVIVVEPIKDLWVSWSTSFLVFPSYETI